LSTGALLQYRHRDNFYNYYLFTPEVTSGNGQPFTGIYDAVWFNNNGPQNPVGAVSTPGSYAARESIAAGYLQAGFHTGKVKINAGIRQELTMQHVNSAADPGTPFSENIGISYHDFLPSFNIIYSFNEKQDLRLSYFSAVSRPSLYDITFFNMDYDDYSVSGNPFLKRSTANNFDVRYDLYQPGIIDELQLTGFFKKIYDPFEKTLIGANDTLYPIPGNGLPYTPASKLTEQLRNYNTATNYGFEFSMVKNFSHLGITANYTFTDSRIEQLKKYKQRVDPQNQATDIITVSRLQQRPLQGQSKHVANMSFSYQLPRFGWTAQLVGIYTSRRIADVSGWYQLDDWQKENVIVDLSLEKTIGRHWKIFAKVTNLLNAGTKIYVNGNINGIPEQRENGKIMIEDGNSRGTMLMGAQFKMK
jgi:hypothetical protein